MESQKVVNESEDKGESEEATVGIESDGRRKEIADETTKVAEINKKYKSQRKLRLFLYQQSFLKNSFN